MSLTRETESHKNNEYSAEEIKSWKPAD